MAMPDTIEYQEFFDDDNESIDSLQSKPGESDQSDSEATDEEVTGPAAPAAEAGPAPVAPPKQARQSSKSSAPRPAKPPNPKAAASPAKAKQTSRAGSKSVRPPAKSAGKLSNKLAKGAASRSLGDFVTKSGPASSEASKKPAPKKTTAKRQAEDDGPPAEASAAPAAEPAAIKPAAESSEPAAEPARKKPKPTTEPAAEPAQPKQKPAEKKGGVDPVWNPNLVSRSSSTKTSASVAGFAIKVEIHGRGEFTAALPTVNACVYAILRKVNATMKTAKQFMVTRYDLYETCGFRYENADYEESRVKKRNVGSYTAPNHPQFVPCISLESVLSSAIGNFA